MRRSCTTYGRQKHPLVLIFYTCTPNTEFHPPLSLETVRPSQEFDIQSILKEKVPCILWYRPLRLRLSSDRPNTGALIHKRIPPPHLRYSARDQYPKPYSYLHPRFDIDPNRGSATRVLTATRASPPEGETCSGLNQMLHERTGPG